MLTALFIVPLVAGVLALVVPRVVRRVLMPITGLVHVAIMVWAWIVRPPPELDGWIALDPVGQIFLSIASVLFLATSLYAAGYLAEEDPGWRDDIESPLPFINAPEAVFASCFLFFLASMTVVTLAQHFSLMWIAIEATTLATAPLLYFHRHKRSLEATWKYLVLCSVGIALALIGTFFIAVSGQTAGGHHIPLLLSELTRTGVMLEPTWLHTGFVFILVGYGTKMGLVPLHSWLPDAHSEAPSPVSALLSGALLNCACLGIWRTLQVYASAGQVGAARELLVGFGVMSVVVAAVFMVNQRDYKRLLAYSSVEHMGVIALGMGLGGPAAFAALLYAIHHSLVKSALFLLSGNILRVFKTKSAAEVRGALRTSPWTGGLWCAGMFAITGTPPFGLFPAKFAILQHAFAHGYVVIGIVCLLFFAIIFIGLTGTGLAMAQGEPPPALGGATRPQWLLVLPPAFLLTLSLVLGSYLPAPVHEVLTAAGATIEGAR